MKKITLVTLAITQVYLLELIFLPLAFPYIYLMLSIHLICILTLIFNFKKCSEYEKYLYLFKMTLIAFFPFFGSFISLFIRKSQFHNKNIERADIFDKKRITKKDIEDLQEKETLNIKKELDFDSFYNILNGKDPQMKLKVISKLSNNKLPASLTVPLLKKCIKSNSHEEKLYAAAALLKIDEKLNSSIQNKNEILRDDYNIHNLFYFVKAVQDYLNSGLIQGTVRVDYLKEVLDLIEKIDDKYADSELLGIYLYLLMELELFDEAKNTIDKIGNTQDISENILIMIAEIFFKLKDYKNTELYISKLRKKNNIATFDIWREAFE
ncbi:MAG: hypothetical protein GY830_08655 [Bacteroidetes bacterium]|nr:hypothetical protein [Bacteroidota bacterium]